MQEARPCFAATPGASCAITARGPAPHGDSRLRAVDVAMTVCAAPAYYPPVRIGRHIYADGGLFSARKRKIQLEVETHRLVALLQ